MKLSKEELKNIYDEVNSRANPTKALFGALIGVIPAACIYILYGFADRIYIVLMVIPPIVIGISARYFGQCYSIKHRIPAGIVGAILYVVACLVLLQHQGVSVLAPVAFAVTFTFAKVKLNKNEARAVSAANLGVIES